MQTFVILHDIRSAHNVGAIFRSADGAGVAKIFLTGYTPRPIDRFGRKQPEIEKTSLGATESVSWEACEDIEKLFNELHTKGTEIIAVEQSPEALDYKDFRPAGDAAYVFGNETEGIPRDVLEKVDRAIEIPMRGKKESLNVSVAAGIVLFNTR